jgi:hypothetical protein
MTTTTTTSTGTAGTDGTSPCSGPTPAGHLMCGPGKTCNTDKCGPPLTFTCVSAGSVPEGASCTDKTDCAAGLTCIHYSTVYACRKLCSIDAECPAGYLCSEGFTCGDNPATAGKYCAKTCSDVVTPAGSAVCGSQFRCNFFCSKTTHTPLQPTCDFEAGTQTSGPCTADENCAAGYYCLGTGADGGQVCTRACVANGDCPSGTTCTGMLYCDTAPTTFHYCKATP